MPITGSSATQGQVSGHAGNPADAAPQTPGNRPDEITPIGPEKPPEPPERITLKPTAKGPAQGNLLIVSRYGELAALTSRTGAGLYLMNDWYKKRKLYDGIAATPDTFQEAMNMKPGAIIFDHTGSDEEPMGKIADTLRARGFPVWGGGEVCDILENNRAFALQVAFKCGMNIPRTLFFDQGRGDPWTSINLSAKQRIYRVKGGLEEAKHFIGAAGGKWVVKLFDTSAASSTFVAESEDEMAYRLDHMQEMEEIKPGQRFLIQEFIKGVEISTELIVQNGEIIGPPNGTIETKKMAAGDTGPNTGCATSVCWIYEENEPQIVQRTFGTDEFKDWLRKPTGPGGKQFPPYNAFIDVNSVVSEKDHQPYILEFTPRFGYSAIFAHMVLMKGDIRKVFLDLAQGREPAFDYAMDDLGYSIRVQIPPAPFADQYIPPKKKSDWAFCERVMEPGTHVRIGGPVDDPNVWLCDVQAHNDGVRTAGIDGVVMEITARSDNIDTLADPAVKLFKDLEICDAFARITDGTDRAKQDFPTLKSFGFEVPEAGEEDEEENDEPKSAPLVLVKTG